MNVYYTRILLNHVFNSIGVISIGVFLQPCMKLQDNIQRENTG